ncbi:hypothetical protein BGZ72_011102 [Mortierella alpina]|nr:hypothetical protein BGZ72_011102 [Mortierella alpina]
MDNREALEGADLRKLGTFLNDKDGTRVLGNLYRTVTLEGHVKWVCIDHYRENYQEKTVNAFRDMVDSLEGSFDENFGRVEVNLPSRVLADQFYLSLEKAKSVHELKIQLSWETTYSDLRRLRDILRKTRVAVLEFGCDDSIGPTIDVLNRGRRYDPIFEIMRHPSIQSFEIAIVHRGFFKRSSPLPRDADFSNLRHLAFGRFDSDADIAKLKLLLARVPNLSSLSLETPTKFFEGSSPWPTKSHFSNLGHLEIGQLDSDAGAVQLKFLSVPAPNLSSLSLKAPKGFFERSCPWPRNADFSNLRRLDIIWLDSDADITKLKLLVAQAPNLSSLSLETSKKFFEGCSPWPTKTVFSNLEHLEIGRLDSDADIVQLKFMIVPAPNLSSLSLKAPKGFFERSRPWPRSADFSNLRHLDIGGFWSRKSFSDADVKNFEFLVARAPKLSNLSLVRDSDEFSAVLSAQQQTKGLIFRDLSLQISESLAPFAFKPVLRPLFKVHGARLETLDLSQIAVDDLAVEALAEATQNGSSLKELYFMDHQQSDKHIKDIASIVARSELRVLRIGLVKEKIRVRILESIQWKYIRVLWIKGGMADQEVAMKALVRGIEKMSERIELEYLRFGGYDVSITQLELLRRIVSLLSLKRLDLWVSLTCKQACALYEAVDFSRMQYILLEARDWNSSEVQMILDVLQHATQLRTIVLDAGITDGQKEQMHAKGIQLLKH